jgi:uncharacterized protein (DUF58 family)
LNTQELLKKVRKIEIKSRGLSNQIFSGEYHSAFKGRGMSFAEVREYQPGDDIRSIDWNVTARFNHPYVKVFEEERELTVMLIVDMSESGKFGTVNQLKRELITELCAVIAFSALQNNDKVGAIFFTGRIELFIPPKKGKTHVLRIIRELLDFKPVQKDTNISQAVRYFANMIKKRCTAFLISDFFDENYADALKIAARKHDLIGLRITDEREQKFPDVGLIQLQDAETGAIYWVNTNDRKFRENYFANALRFGDMTNDIFRKAGMDHAIINTRDSYVKPLMNLFRKR